MKCRIDGSSCNIFLNLGKMPVANGFCKKKNFKNEFFFKLKAAFNKKLSLFQIVNYPNPKKMFNKNYPFYTSSSNHMINHFKKFSEFIKKKYLSKGSILLEIGSNDGTFLKNFNKKNVYGFEPSKSVHLKAKKQGLKSINKFFNIKNILLLKSLFKKVDVIVLDHHVAESALPTTTSLVNPNRVDDKSHYSYLAAVGVTFVTIVALNRELRDSGVYDNIGFREPDLFQYLDLVALGTVADVVPLKGLNRAFVQQGLKVLKMRHNVGLRELTEICGIEEEPNSYHLGFVLGPRINAGGRVGDALLGTKLLCTEEVSAARDIATRLDGYNRERQQIESTVLNEAVQIASKKQTSSLILTVGEDWHPGVIGIVASRLKDHFGKPALVLTKKSTHESVGSGRSIPGIDLGSLVIKARQAGILSAGGGHAMAAGFTLENTKISELENFMDIHISQLIKDNKIVPTAKVDGVLSLQAASNSLITDINKLGPFGSGNSEPRFGFESIRIGRSMVVGQNHVKCYLSGLDGSSLSAIAFNCVDTKLGENLLNHSNLPLHVIGRLKLNSWQGKTNPQLLIDDAAEAR